MCGIVGGDVNSRCCYKGCVRDVVFRRGTSDVDTSCDDALWTTARVRSEGGEPLRKSPGEKSDPARFGKGNSIALAISCSH